MTDNHPITPPPELVAQWIKECDNPEEPRWQEYEQDIATLSARWGADQELEACCEWLTNEGLDRFPMRGMREARRPKPPSLKEQALSELNLTADSDGAELSRTQVDLIRRALEALDD